jgi:hypothetical protein
MKRGYQFLLIGTFLPVCWMLMQGVHEFGHAIAGLATGGTVTKVVLHPLAISRTDVNPNPRPLIVVWSGPLVGVLLPLLICGACRLARIPGVYLVRFFTGFCLIANGAYIGIGSFEGIGDTGDMLRLGTPMWVLWAFGAATVPTGFVCWHKLGSHFGFGDSQGNVDTWAAYLSLSLLAMILLVTSVFSTRV